MHIVYVNVVSRDESINDAKPDFLAVYLTFRRSLIFHSFEVICFLWLQGTSREIRLFYCWKSAQESIEINTGSIVFTDMCEEALDRTNNGMNNANLLWPPTELKTFMRDQGEWVVGELWQFYRPRRQTSVTPKHELGHFHRLCSRNSSERFTCWDQDFGNYFWRGRVHSYTCFKTFVH